jgi:hypothetical protein
MKASPLFLHVMLIFFFAGTLATHGLVLAETANWSQVAFFTGLGSRLAQNTTNFTIGHPEWRIEWSFTVNSSYSAEVGFFVYVFPQGETKNYVDYIYSIGLNASTSGTEYIHNTTGTFYMNVLAAQPAILSYTLIVQQDLNSVPEFPSSTTLLLALTAALVATIALACGKQGSRRV